MVLQEVSTSKNVPLAHNSISSHLGSNKGVHQDLASKDNVAGIAVPTTKKRYANAMSENLQPDTEIGTETCELANKKQKFEPSFYSSSETASASTVLELMGMEEWVCYEECTPSDTWAANIALAKEDWPSMDCNSVMNNSSTTFLHGLVHDSWMGFEGPIIPVSTVTTNAIRQDETPPGVAAKDSDDKDQPPDATNPKNLTLKHTCRKCCTPEAEENEDTSADVRVIVPMNHMDPCSFFPTEVWLMVLKHLPLSVIAHTSTVSILWLEGARAYQGWKMAARIGKMGVPSWVYKTFMSLVCSRSLFTCDRCYGSSMKMDIASHIPLPVLVNGVETDTWLVCHSCRCEYYQTHPEQSRPPFNQQDQGTYQHKAMVTRVQAKEQYGLSSRQLRGIKRRYQKSVAYYKQSQIQARACKVHSGWVGVNAVLRKEQMDRHVRYGMRLQADRTQSSQKKKKSPSSACADSDIDFCNFSANNWLELCDIKPMWVDSLAELGHEGEHDLGQGLSSGFGAL
ncbi:hypothetical protein BG006_003278 [Podila minutissima]|uniref:F-box domain-containing protein n=1 Tax=Podila minutissima TaxID=64525 RepID=A0A9P5S8G1_9FUNG|nr:hypothetical protein BG006_003278 [Podila minutissima]